MEIYKLLKYVLKFEMLGVIVLYFKRKVVFCIVIMYYK